VANSSTSNSKKKFSLKLLGCCGLILIAYHFFVPAVANIPVEYQNQSQDNAIKVEDFVFGASKDVVIVGSSLTARLDHDFKFAGSYNMALGGDSALSGLEIIKRTNKLPKLLIVEGNVLLPKSDSLISSVLAQPNLFLKTMSPVFREQFQPVTVFNSYLKSFFKKPVKAFNAESFNIALNEHIKAHKELTEKNQAEWADRLKELSSYIEDLRAKGVQVVFLYMPMHPEVYNSPLAEYQRQKLTAYLQDNKIPLITPDSLNYQTSDGIHLDVSSIGTFCKYLENQVAKYSL
jgi:hypothetical protein